MIQNQKTLIIPDIHTKFKTAESIIKRESPNRVVFLGDYFDVINETVGDTENMARWLEDSLQKNDRIHLIGNHDLSYMTSNPILKCSGFSESKKFLIDKHEIPWQLMKPYCYVGNYLCTHAGVSKQFFEEYAKTGSLIEFLMQADDDLKHIDDMYYSQKFFQVGRSRGGLAENGGIVWCDYDEFEDIPGIKQIFGHTYDSYVRHVRNHWCLDTGLRHYAIHEKNTLMIKST